MEKLENDLNKEQYAGELCYKIVDAIRDIDLLRKHLAFNIKIMADRALWKQLLLKPDNRLVTHDNFMNFLFNRRRGALNFPGYIFIDNLLKLQSDRDGDEALEILRREIPNYDDFVEQERKYLANGWHITITTFANARVWKKDNDLKHVYDAYGDEEVHLFRRLNKDNEELAVKFINKERLAGKKSKIAGCKKEFIQVSGDDIEKAISQLREYYTDYEISYDSKS